MVDVAAISAIPGVCGAAKTGGTLHATGTTDNGPAWMTAQGMRLGLMVVTGVTAIPGATVAVSRSHLVVPPTGRTRVRPTIGASYASESSDES